MYVKEQIRNGIGTPLFFHKGTKSILLTSTLVNSLNESGALIFHQLHPELGFVRLRSRFQEFVRLCPKPLTTSEVGHRRINKRQTFIKETLLLVFLDNRTHRTFVFLRIESDKRRITTHGPSDFGRNSGNRKNIWGSYMYNTSLGCGVKKSDRKKK